MVVVMAALVVVPAAASDYLDEPTFMEGNPSCSDLNDCWNAYKIDGGPYAGTYNVGGGTVTIEMDGEYCFNFTAEGVEIYAVIVKGGPCANVYNYYEDYGDTVSADNGLCTPLNENSGCCYGISHIDFCYEACEPTPTPPPVPEFPISALAVMGIFGLAMCAVVASLGKNQ